MSLTDKLARERRGRLAAERMLELKSRELMAANRKLSDHALKLSDTIIAQREVVATTRAQAHALKEEAETMKGVAQETRANLVKAEKAVTIAERRLWDSVETITDNFAVFDAEDRLVAANAAWLNLFDGLEDARPGLTYMDMLRLMMEEGLVDPGEKPPGDWIIEMLDRWDTPEIPDITIRTWDGRHMRLHDRRSANGDMVCLGIDVTGEMRRQKELREARDAAEAATRAKSAFLAKMSHELRTPMNGVVGMADLLLDTDVDEEQALFIRTIRNSGEALLEIINDVLDFSRAEAEKMELFPESFDLEGMLCEVITLSLPVARDRGLDLLLDYAPDAPVIVTADPKRLRQVVVNLLGNAIKFTEKGYVRIGVRAAPPRQDGQHWGLQIAVEDTGIGIPEDMRSHIFGQFNQVQDEKNRRFEGTGLGLAITRQLVELMGGQIGLVTETGRGTTFTVDLSLEAEAPAFGLTPWPADAGPRIVVATASRAGVRMAKNRSAMTGMEIEVARSPDVLRSILAEGAEPDMVAIDSDFCDSDPAALVREMRGMCPRSQFLCVVRQGQQGVRTALAGSGVDHVLHYPYRNAEIAEIYAALSEPPLRFAPEAPPEEENANAPCSSDPTPPRAPAKVMRILAAEDNKTNRFVFSKMLKSLSVDLIFAENGRQAVELYKSERPDLVFMDISMPEMDGKAATRAIRDLEDAQGWHRVPVVAMTAHALAGDSDDILAAGLDHYLTKPLKKQLIHEQIAIHAPAGVEPFDPPLTASEAVEGAMAG
ncbi:response regulator [Oceanicola sp. D3]|uniref:ATP-binding protein n=1 Tax=Oceanicola sp. D3 TaxID=2587163 RepID=UPI0011209F83|nr:ATP-binding protein [Oceanicola sp. D3]QDC08293.1 response regulator [Oceanicola sp. D3]